MEFSVNKKDLDHALKTASVALGDSDILSEKHFKICDAFDGLLIKASNPQTFCQFMLPVDFTTKVRGSFEFCVEGDRFISAISVLDDTDVCKFKVDFEKDVLYIRSGNFKGSFPIKRSIPTHFIEFKDRVDVNSEKLTFNTKEMIHALSFLKKFPLPPTSNIEVSTLLHMKEGCLVGGEIDKLGFYFSSLFKAGMQISSAFITDFLVTLKNVSSDTFTYKKVKDNFCVMDFGNVAFGFQEWGNVPDQVMKRIQAYDPVEVVKCEKSTLVTLIKKMNPYLDPKADYLTLNITGKDKDAVLKVSVLNDMGDMCTDSLQVDRKQGDNDYQIKVNYKKMLEVLDAMSGSYIYFEVDNDKIIRISEAKEGAFSVALLASVVK